MNEKLLVLALTIFLICAAIFILVLAIEFSIHPEYLTSHYITK